MAFPPSLARVPLKPHPAPDRTRSLSETPPPRDGWELALTGDLTEKQADLLESLLEIPSGGRGTLFFDSPGGSAYVGISLASLILLRGLKATGVVLGECSSAALLPFAACCERYVLPCSTLYFHPVRWSSEEDIQLEQAAEWTRHFGVMEDEMDILLSKLLQRPFEEVRGWTRPGRFFSGTEIAQMGLARLLELPGPDLATQLRTARQAATPG